MISRLFLSAIATTIMMATPVFALEDSSISDKKLPFALEAPDQPQQLAPLWGVRATGPAGTLLKVPAGFRAPVHAHTADYRGIVIKGHWKHWLTDSSEAKAQEMAPGSYWTQKAAEMHDDACVSDTECVVLLINVDPYETYLPK